ncbi:MAG: divalent metal cation transporter [Crocinitomicaceae bacterium]|nr:divalent metal cation transporter [Crocinitomicaceae bacterium]
MAEKKSISNFIKTLGPGILFASTAIGVSHLVQSTRAGAEYGFALIAFVIAANVFKYPFFEYGSRYANATGTTIIDGYNRIGKWMIWLYFLITIGSMFFVCGAVGAVTSGFLQNLFGISSWGIWATVCLFVFCTSILIAGKYKILDSMTKIIGVVLLLSTLLAFVLALMKGASPAKADFVAPEIFSNDSMLFIIALMGWMPTAVDLSAWSSLWTIERIKQTGYKPSMKETLADFNFGYIVSAVLAVCFLTLGAYVLYGTGKELPEGAAGFASEIVRLFTTFIGDWSYIIIAIAGFSIMFGTCITVFDGYARSIERSSILLFQEKVEEKSSSSKVYIASLLMVALGSFGIIFFLGKQLKSLVDLATTMSFMIAPVIAIVNYKLVTSSHVKPEDQPKLWLRILSWLGIIFLTGFAIYYVKIRFFS